MRRLAVCLALTVAACGSPAGSAGSNAVTTLLASYTLAATGIASYAEAPGSDPIKVATVRRCELSAWLLIKPVADSLLAKTPPATAAVSAASSAINQLQGCLSHQGVPFA